MDSFMGHFFLAMNAAVRGLKDGQDHVQWAAGRAVPFSKTTVSISFRMSILLARKKYGMILMTMNGQSVS